MTTDTDPADLRVLQVATSNRSFFQQQVQVVEERGVECETLIVPRPRSGGRGPREYLSAYLQLLGKGLADFDLIHVNYGLIGPLGLCQPARPVVLTLWGSDVMGPEWLRRVSQTAARWSDTVIAPTKPLARRLDVPHEYVPFGVDTDLFKPTDRDGARERVGWDTDERVVLFPYDPDRPVKNHDLAKRVVARVPNATLKTVTGVAYETMPAYMNASDALLVTSDHESGPMSVCEATACNLPVVSRDVGFVADVLEDVEPTGIADTEDELVTALTRVLDADKRSNGQAVTDRSLDRLGDDLVRVYQKALN